MSAVAEEIRKPTPMLSPSRWGLFNHANNRHVITVEEGTAIETVLSPSFLSHLAGKLRPYDEIVVRVDDGAYWAELLVLQVGPTWARTTLLKHVQITAPADESANDAMNPYEIKWRGPNLKFSIIRKADGAVVREKIDSKPEASTWLADYIRTTTGGG